MFVSLGCDKNLVDSEMMLGMLYDAGMEITNDEDEADAVVVNTCCFILDAKEESINALIEYGELKKNGKCRALIACGCLAQRYKDEIHEQIPEVDAVIGTAAFDQLTEVLNAVLEKHPKDAMADIDTTLVCGKRRVSTTGGYYAYLKIAEGCDKRCTYCIIPKVRGSYRSVPMETLLAEAAKLAESGVRELILVAQETTVYGKDIYGKKSLPRLLEELCKIEELQWIRILYCYPEEIDDELIAVIQKESKICHYLDIPIQHSEDYILQRMGRRTNRLDLIRIISQLRNAVPDICLRTTLITGFPGETKELFEGLKNFVSDMRFDRLGVFTYSAEEDTIAAGLPDQIPEEEKNRRRDVIMELQQQIAFDKAKGMLGQVVDVIVEGTIPDENLLVARSYMDAPGVDGLVFIEDAPQLMSGTVAKVLITDSDDYDLIGGLVDEFTE